MSEEYATSTPVREAPSTGDPAVDAVIAEVGSLEDRPLEEHVGVFERAHDGLRAALDGRSEEPAPRAAPPSPDPA